jgi:succinate dehydrogenase / fumarate reductase iron-sulfur subunit
MPSTVHVQIKRQDKPEAPSRYETFDVPYEPGMNMTTILQRIAAHPVTAEGHATTPVAYDACCLEEVCGACTMVINGRVRQGCTALIDDLLNSGPDQITVEPMTKFPVVRDLVVNRRRMFEALKRIRGWVEVDDYSDRGASPPMPPVVQEEAYPLSRCMTCGCCLEVCPQYNDKTNFVGAAAISQAVLFNEHPVGALTADQRLQALMEPGGITACGNAQACVEVCPKDIPLTDSIAKAGRQTTIHSIKRWLRR